MKDPDWSHADFTEHFHYDPESGVLSRVRRTGNNWKTGPVEASHGDKYIGFRFRGQFSRVHRAAFFYMTGQWPGDRVDHKDLNSLNNCWLNLRDCSSSQNNCNRAANNDTGIKNVYITPSGTFQVRVAMGGREVTKTFKTIEEATEFAEELRITLHGLFARE